MKFLAISLVLVVWSGVASASEDRTALNLAKAKQAARCSVMLYLMSESLSPDERRDVMMDAKLLKIAATGWGADSGQFNEWADEIFSIASEEGSEAQLRDEGRICDRFVFENDLEIYRLGLEGL